jgi:hypothetical protein
MPENPYQPPKEVNESLPPMLVPELVLARWGALGIIVGAIVGWTAAVFFCYPSNLDRAVPWASISGGIAGASAFVFLRSLVQPVRHCQDESF